MKYTHYAAKIGNTPRTMSPEALQRRYYTGTAACYDEMHVHGGDGHEVALRHVSSSLSMLGITSILDVGTGTGRAALYFGRNHPEVTTVGVEPVAALLRHAIIQEDGRQARWGRADGYALPFAEASFDAVCEFGVLHHVRRPDAVVGEMMRVARKAIFLSDSNRFGQGAMAARLAKVLLCRTDLWPLANFLRTRGRGYTISAGDGVAYSYSVYDSCDLLARWADRIIFVPTSTTTSWNWCHPLLTASQVLLCAIRFTT